MRWLRGLALVLVVVMMLVGIAGFVLVISGKPLGAWDVPARIAACVGILGMVLVGPVASKL